MIAGYITKSTVSGMGFTLLIFVLTLQNFFIFRCFWNKATVNDINATSGFNDSNRYNRITYFNFANDLQTNYSLTSASFIDAIGCTIALYGGYSAVIGKIGLA
jgi:hypothetical protein